jgi:putative transferase (TIGR04331 family)
LRKKVLIISQLRSKIFDTIDNDILFLNEGCKLYKNNKNYKYETLKNNEVLNYKITSLNKKFSYLLKIYENLLEELSIKLNKIHNTNYPVQSWRIIIGPWLFVFISIIFHNWKLLKYINNNYLIKRVYIAKFIFSKNFFNDYNDFACSSQTDEFNNLIYGDLLKYFKKIKIKYFFKK